MRLVSFSLTKCFEREAISFLSCLCVRNDLLSLKDMETVGGWERSRSRLKQSPIPVTYFTQYHRCSNHFRLQCETANQLESHWRGFRVGRA